MISLIYAIRNPILAFAIMPKPAALSGLIFLLFFLSAKGCYLSVKMAFKSGRQFDGFDRLLLLLLFLTAFWSAISNLVNVDRVDIKSIFHIAKAILYFFVYYYYAHSYERDFFKNNDKLYTRALLFTYLILYIVSFDQLFEAGLSNFIYSSERVNADLLRVTGALLNPNFFGFYLLLLFIYSRQYLNSIKSILVNLPAIPLLLMSGSRSALLLLFIIIPLAALASDKGIKLRYILYTVIFTTIFAALSVAYLSHNADTYGYMSQMLTLLDGDGLENISSYAARQDIWKGLGQEFDRLPEYLVVFGVGSYDFFSVTDNDFLAMYYKSGLVGIFLQLVIIAIIIIGVCYSRVKAVIKTSFFIFLFLMFALSFQAQTFTSIGYNIILFSWLGYIRSRSHENMCSSPNS